MWGEVGFGPQPINKQDLKYILPLQDTNIINNKRLFGKFMCIFPLGYILFHSPHPFLPPPSSVPPLPPSLRPQNGDGRWGGEGGGGGGREREEEEVRRRKLYIS